MIKTIDIINKLKEENKEQYIDMIKMVNIPDFYKCIAQFSGISISNISDNRIIEYLMTWAKNKYRFFEMLGHKTRLDTHFIYKNERTNYKDEYEELMKKFPVYALWLEGFKEHKENNIGQLPYNPIRTNIIKLFPQFNYEKSTITHFFKSQLDAPDDLVTGIGRVYENKKVEATHTLSIDPVDIMLASENPYDWTSCYRLELNRSDSHADGCMAAILDTSSLIAYVWSSEGEYNMYNTFKFKNIRYYRIRQWININDNWGAIHFASPYPNRDGYDGELNKQLREVVEAIVANHAKVANIWKQNENYMMPDGWNQYRVQIERVHCYGYSEFQNDYIWINKEIFPELRPGADLKDIITAFHVYDETYSCACGCDNPVYPSEDIYDEDDAYDGDMVYNGEGFCAENFYTYEEEREPELKWCNYCDDWCIRDLEEYDDCDMEDCPIYKENHKPCSLDTDHITCDRAAQVSTYIDDNDKEICHANCTDCEHCLFWKDKEHYEKKEE